jgi:hypothetical protein
MSEQHEHEEGQEVGVALAFRIFEAEGVMTLAEAEITPLEDEPTALGATLVFHSLATLDLTSEAVEDEPPIGALELGDVLTHDQKAPSPQQLQAILRQLSRMRDDELQRFLVLARQQAEL